MRFSATIISDVHGETYNIAGEYTYINGKVEFFIDKKKSTCGSDFLPQIACDAIAEQFGREITEEILKHHRRVNQ